MEDDARNNLTNKDDPRLGRFVLDLPNQYVLRYGRLLHVQKFGDDAGNWRSTLFISAVGLAAIAMLTYSLHLGSGLVYVLLLVDGLIAALVKNQRFGRRH